MIEIHFAPCLTALLAVINASSSVSACFHRNRKTYGHVQLESSTQVSNTVESYLVIIEASVTSVENWIQPCYG